MADGRHHLAGLGGAPAQLHRRAFVQAVPGAEGAGNHHRVDVVQAQVRERHHGIAGIVKLLARHRHAKVAHYHLHAQHRRL